MAMSVKEVIHEGIIADDRSERKKRDKEKGTAETVPLKTAWNGYYFLSAFCCSFAQLSFSVTVLLKTMCSGVLSLQSTQK